MIPESWTPHRRDDGEIIGYIRGCGPDYQPMDVLGRPAGPASGWIEAEELLNGRGLLWLMEPHFLVQDGREQRVRVVEVTPEYVRVVGDDFGAASAIDAQGLATWTLEVPVDDRLRAGAQ